MKGIIYAVYLRRPTDTKPMFSRAFETAKEARKFAKLAREAGIQASVGSYVKHIGY